MLTRENILSSIFVLLIIPILIGNFFCAVFKKEKRIVNYYCYGLTLTFAVLEVISVPLIVARKSFNFLFDIAIILLLIIAVLGIVIRFIKRDITFKEIDFTNLFFVVLAIGVVGYFLFLVFTHQVINADDSRFVVHAVDMLENNTLFLTNPATGEVINDFTLNDSYKDIVSPWPIIFAMISKITGVRVVVIAHSFLPLALSLYVISAWWIFSSKVMKKENIMYQSMFVIIILLMAMYGNDTGGGLINNVFMKFLFRIWEGKSVVATAGIPLMYICMFDYYKKNTIFNLFSILLVNLAICFMSANGIVIGAVMIGCFATAYTIVDFKVSHFIKLIPLALLNAFLYMLSNHVVGLK